MTEPPRAKDAMLADAEQRRTEPARPDDPDEVRARMREARLVYHSGVRVPADAGLDRAGQDAIAGTITHTLGAGAPASPPLDAVRAVYRLALQALTAGLADDLPGARAAVDLVGMWLQQIDTPPVTQSPGGSRSIT